MSDTRELLGRLASETRKAFIHIANGEPAGEATNGIRDIAIACRPAPSERYPNRVACVDSECPACVPPAAQSVWIAKYPHADAGDTWDVWESKAEADDWLKGRDVVAVEYVLASRLGEADRLREALRRAVEWARSTLTVGGQLTPRCITEAEAALKEKSDAKV